MDPIYSGSCRIRVVAGQQSYALISMNGTESLRATLDLRAMSGLTIQVSLQQSDDKENWSSIGLPTVVMSLGITTFQQANVSSKYARILLDGMGGQGGSADVGLSLATMGA